MKILEGRDGEDWKLEVKCEIIKDQYGLARDPDKEHCGSLLEIDKYDVKAQRWFKYCYQLRGIDYFIVCPKCGCEIEIRPERLPEYIKTKALSEYDDKQRKDDKNCY